MSAADRLLHWLGGRPSVGGVVVVGWRTEVTEGAGVRVGARASALGGPYEGPGIAVRLGGSLDLHWSDGRQSRVGLDRQSLMNPGCAVAEWRASSFRERDGRLPPLAGPTPLPAVETADPAVAAAVTDHPGRLMALLDDLRRGCLEGGARRVDGVLRAGHGRRTVATSAGFFATWEETSCSLDLWAEEIAHAGFARRCLPTPADRARMLAELAALGPMLRQEQALPPAPLGILLMPRVVDELLGRLVLPNLHGGAMRDGRSPFTLDDLAMSRPVMRADVGLVVDTTLPLELATAPCSSEGTPAARVALISGGRLVSPILDRATAQQVGLPPTPSPRGRPIALLVSDADPIGLDEALARLGNGVVVREMPGLHTQQTRRSRYALVVPDAQVVVDGAAGGRCSVRVAGDVLDHLAQPSTCLVRIAGERGVGLLVLDGGEVLPAGGAGR